MIDNLSIITGRMASVAIIFAGLGQKKNKKIVNFSISVSRFEFSGGLFGVYYRLV